MASNLVVLSLRGAEFVWSLLVIALIGNMIDLATDGDPAVVNYAMFVAVFSMVSLIYLVGSTFTDAYIVHVALPAVIDILNTIFWFCAAVALAAELGAHSCTNKTYTSSNKITKGAGNHKHRCREAQASTAFLWFGFACYAASVVFSFLGSRSSTVNLRGGAGPKGGPAMSQV